MTKVVFFRSGGQFYGFRETGHTGYGDEGYDILCAALSSMTMLLINSINVVFAGELDYTVDEGATEIMVQSKSALPEFEADERVRFAVSGLFLTYYNMLEDMLLHDDMYEFTDEAGFKVKVVDRDYNQA